MGGQRVGAHRLKCRNEACGFESEILDRRMPPLAGPIIERKFKELGWEVGKNEKHDVCPKCVEAERIDRRKRRSGNGNNVISITQAQGEPMAQTTATAEEPRSMTREDRRVVFAKLNDVYIDQKAGYAAPWTDAAVAKDLGVPAKWVSDIREENFGPTRDNSEIRELLDRATKIGQQAATTLADAEKLRGQAAALAVQCNAMNGTLKDLLRAVEVLNVAASRIERAIAN